MEVTRTVLVPIAAAVALLFMRRPLVRRGSVGQGAAFLIAAAFCTVLGVVNLYLRLVGTP